MTSEPSGSDPDPDTVPRAPGVPGGSPAAGRPFLDPDRWGPAPDPAPPPGTDDPAAGPAGPSGGRRTRWVWLLAALAVVAAAVIVPVVLTGGGGSGTSPAQTVRTYLDDLAAGDAAGALAQGRPPGSRTFLTSDVLRAQQRRAAISDVRVGATSTHGGHADVRATYRFGSRRADVSFALTRAGDAWLLEHSTVAIDVSTLTGIPAPTVFGKPVGGASTIEVFPGPVEWGSGNRFFAVTQHHADLFALAPTDPSASYTELDAALNAAGKAAVVAAVSRYLAGCAASHSLRPAHCPQQQFDAKAVASSARWRLLSDVPRSIRYRSTADAITTLEVTASLRWSCAYRAYAGRTKIVTRTEPSIDGSIDGSIDLTAATPAFTTTS